MSENLVFNINDFKRIGSIGISNFGQTVAYRNQANDFFAVSSIQSSCCNSKMFKFIPERIKKMHLLHHPSISRYQGYSVRSSNISISSDYTNYGSLKEVIELDRSGNKEKLYDVTCQVNIIVSVIFALKYLHSNNIIHGNLKPSNIYLFDTLQAIVGDYGLSDIKLFHKHSIDSLPYFPPECFRNEITEKSDVYSFGWIVLEILTSENLFLRMSNPKQINKIIPTSIPEFWRDLISECIKDDPSKRLTSEEVFNIICDKENIKKMGENVIVEDVVKHIKSLFAFENEKYSELREKIVLNDVNALYEYAYAVLNNRVALTSDTKPLNLFMRAADQNHAPSQYYAGRLLLKENDNSLAMQYLKKAYDQGDDKTKLFYAKHNMKPRSESEHCVNTSNLMADMDGIIKLQSIIYLVENTEIDDILKVSFINEEIKTKTIISTILDVISTRFDKFDQLLKILSTLISSHKELKLYEELLHQVFRRLNQFSAPYELAFLAKFLSRCDFIDEDIIKKKISTYTLNPLALTCLFAWYGSDVIQSPLQYAQISAKSSSHLANTAISNFLKGVDVISQWAGKRKCNFEPKLIIDSQDEKSKTINSMIAGNRYIEPDLFNPSTLFFENMTPVQYVALIGDSVFEHLNFNDPKIHKVAPGTPSITACALIGQNEKLIELLSKKFQSGENMGMLIKIASLFNPYYLNKIIKEFPLHHKKFWINSLSQSNNVFTFQMMVDLENDADCGFADQCGNTPLHFAALYGKIEMMNFLCSIKQIDVNAKNKKGETPLHFAVMSGSTAAVSYLVGLPKVSLAVQDDSGYTPLHIALFKSKPEIVQILFEHSDTKIVDKKNRTWLDVAKQIKNETMIGLCSALKGNKI